MLYETETGSIYEVDEANKRIRRLTGKGNPTPRMGLDGEWREYHDLNLNSHGGLSITWVIDQVEDENGNYGSCFRTTQTSSVIRTQKTFAAGLAS